MAPPHSDILRAIAPSGANPLGPLGIPKGAQRAVLGTDAKSGGETCYAHFPAGTRFELHWYAYAEYAVVLRGKVAHTLGKETSALQVGDYVVIHPKIAHGWDVDPGADAYLLNRRTVQRMRISWSGDITPGARVP